MSQPFKEGSLQQLAPWAVRGPRRKAWALLVFGMVVAVVCTRATLTAVQQEAEVVQLAQELVASEAAVGLIRFVSVCLNGFCLIQDCQWISQLVLNQHAS